MEPITLIQLKEILNDWDKGYYDDFWLLSDFINDYY